MISFIIGGVVGVTIALFIAGASRSNHDNYIYMEGYCAGIKSVRGEEHD